MKYILGSDSLTAFVNGKPYTVNRSAEIFKTALDAIKEDDSAKFLAALDVKTTVSNMLKEVPELIVKDKEIYFGTRCVSNSISTRIFDMMELGLDIQPIAKMVAKLMQNPSKRAVDEAFDFIEACDLPITENGNILAYRRIGADYMDQHSRSVPNKPVWEFSADEIASMPITCGKKNEVTVEIDPDNGMTKVSMPRNAVDEDKNRTCSQGLHFCSYEYLKSFGGSRTVVVEIDPADIVAIPSDYNNAKGRTSSYWIVEEIGHDSNNVLVEKISIKTVEKVQDRKGDYSTKMDQEKADNLRHLHSSWDWSVEELAEEYGISVRQVKRIINDEAWV